VRCYDNAYHVTRGHAVTQLVEGLRYKPEGRWFEGIFYLYNPSGLTIDFGPTQLLTERITKGISLGAKVADAQG
jgi:hypothetical protein